MIKIDKLKEIIGILCLAVIANLIFILFNIYLVTKHNQEIFGSITEFNTALFVFPLVIAIFSVFFETLVRKLYFIYLSMISVYYILIREFVIIGFDKYIFTLFLFSLAYPLLLVWVIQIITLKWRNSKRDEH